jgi:hypothetical protein
MTQRFTVDGSAELEQRLERWCAEFAEDVRRVIPANVLEAIVLGGGYGRGEGGVLRTEEGEKAYNDLEFYIFVRGPLLWRDRQFRRQLSELAHRWSEKAGIEFESKLLTLEKIQKAPVSMFYYDLAVGHRWLFGAGGEFKDCDHHRAAHRIPLHEATRLLMNRSSGLLFAQVTDDPDFIRRNISKAQLALGDVVLTAFGRYHSSCRERHRRLEKLETLPFPELLRHHQIGVEFKLHPFASSEPLATLRAELTEVRDLAGRIFLWLEQKRLETSFETHRDYALSPVHKHPDQRIVRNALINLRAFRRVGARYPRERLLESLSLLLWTPDPLAHLGKLQRDLVTRETTFAGLVCAYRKIWNRFN